MSRDQGRRRWALAVLLVPLATLLVFIVMVGLSARSLSTRAADSGSISLTDVSLQQESGQLYLSARADIDLPESIKAGLDSGVPLDFLLSLNVSIPRPYWFDRMLTQYHSRFRLTYYELTRHYRVHAMDSDVSRNFRSLSAALTGLGEFDRLPITTVAAIEALQTSDVNDVQSNADIAVTIPTGESAQLLAALSFRLDAQSLPLPLQPLIASSWRLASEEYQWQVN